MKWEKSTYFPFSLKIVNKHLSYSDYRTEGVHCLESIIPMKIDLSALEAVFTHTAAPVSLLTKSAIYPLASLFVYAAH